MALKLAYVPNFKTTFPDAYHRIVEVTLYPMRLRADIVVAVYPDAATRQADQEAYFRGPDDPKMLKVYGEDYTAYFSAAALAARNMDPIKSAYVYLKTLGSYQGATDV